MTLQIACEINPPKNLRGRAASIVRGKTSGRFGLLSPLHIGCASKCWFVQNRRIYEDEGRTLRRLNNTHEARSAEATRLDGATEPSDVAYSGNPPSDGELGKSMTAKQSSFKKLYFTK